MRTTAAWVTAVALGGSLLGGTSAAGAATPTRYDVTVARTAFGIPHIKAKDYTSLAYGYGKAVAEDTICTLAEAYVTVNAQRSRFFGPDRTYAIRGNGSRATNLNSDFFYQRIIDDKTVERLAAQPFPQGPRPELLTAVQGYVDGYNAHLREAGGADGIDDPTCRGESWVRPITKLDALRRFYQLSLLASSGVAIDGIAGAQPVTGPVDAQAALREVPAGTLDERLGGLGSNAYGLGKDATASGHGMLYGNPHFPWQGPERFYQAHLTVPGKVDVMGGSLLGVPVVNIGFTKGVAWSHTVSTARRFVPYQLTLQPGSLTTYLVDGKPEKMVPHRTTVTVRRPDGSLAERTRTLWTTRYGPIFTSILGLPLFPWNPATAYALHDGNAGNFGRLLNHFFDVNRAQSVADVERILKEHQGIPWVNTIAADTSGQALYADIGTVPGVDRAKYAGCQTALGLAADQLQRLPVLDGSRASCAPDSSPDAAAPGILGPARMPLLKRTDHVSNMNDSHWLTNPEQPLEGFSRIIGDERTARTPRTRVGIRIIQDRLAGTDGMPGNRFTLDGLQEAAFGNRVFTAELWRDDLVAACRALGTVVTTTSGPVDVREACEVLARWDRRIDLGSKGSILWQRFVTRLGLVGSPLVPYPAGPYARPFDAGDPVGTPSGLATVNPLVLQALGQAVKDLEGAGLPLDASPREGQTVTRRGETIPIQGGSGGAGVFNVITPTWDPKKGYTDVEHGSSYIQAVELTPGCPKARTLLTYGLSTNPRSPRTSDQTKEFSAERWVEPPFCPSALEKDRSARRVLTATRGTTVAEVTEARGTRRPRIVVRTARAARVVVTVRRGSRVVRRLVRTARPGRPAAWSPRVARGAYRVDVRAGRSARLRVAARQR